MGNRIQCTKCKSYFGNILCQKCLKINPLSKNFFKNGYMICRYSECEKKSYIINCIHCQGINVFNGKKEEIPSKMEKSAHEVSKKVPIPGQKIKCGNRDCEKVSNL